MPPFVFAVDVAVILHALLDRYERHPPGKPFARAIRVHLEDLNLPGYTSQVDPAPRQIANEQLQTLAGLGFVRLSWLPGETGHLLQAVTLLPERAPALFPWLGRPPVSGQSAALRELLLGDRFRFAPDDWRLRAIDDILTRLRVGTSPSPFTLADPDFNRDLLAALVALDGVVEETPYRVFSVRTFNDSKAFERLRSPLASLARRYGPGWHELTAEEVLAELGLTANPTHVYLSGPWRITTAAGRLVNLADFHPAVGAPSAMVGRAQHVEVDAAVARRIVCVENLASFYELIRYEGDGLAALCLWGNPAPPVRHLLACLAESLPPEIPLLVWADLDYGGLSIISQLRKTVSPRFTPYRMDRSTLDGHRAWARPLAENDERLLARLRGRASLADLHPLIEYMLERRLKLEQEAVRLADTRPPAVDGYLSPPF
jgi:hypothetical protein